MSVHVKDKETESSKRQKPHKHIQKKLIDLTM